jgi:hypothetical protein
MVVHPLPERAAWNRMAVSRHFLFLLYDLRVSYKLQCLFPEALAQFSILVSLRILRQFIEVCQSHQMWNGLLLTSSSP